MVSGSIAQRQKHTTLSGRVGILSVHKAKRTTRVLAPIAVHFGIANICLLTCSFIQRRYFTWFLYEPWEGLCCNPCNRIISCAHFHEYLYLLDLLRYLQFHYIHVSVTMLNRMKSLMLKYRDQKLGIIKNLASKNNSRKPLNPIDIDRETVQIPSEPLIYPYVLIDSKCSTRGFRVIDKDLEL